MKYILLSCCSSENKAGEHSVTVQDDIATSISICIYY